MMEVILEGFLERNNVLSNKEWKRGYCVFRKNPISGNKVLEFYKDSNWQKSEPRAVCNLLSNYEISHSGNSTKKRFVFSLRTVDQEYELGAPSESMRDVWMHELVKAKGLFNDRSIQNIIQTFNVVLLNEDFIIKHLNGSMGTCQLVITDAEVILATGNTVKIRWKFSTIRRYKSQTGTFVLEVGRKAPTGEGEFRFDTANPVQLFDVLEKAVKDRIRAKGIEIGTLSSPSETPPKLPSTLQLQPHLSSPTRGTAPSHVGSEYSHLNHQIQKPSCPQPADYDMLFTNRLNNQRKSEPNIKPPFLNNTRKLTSDTKISTGDQYPEEAYERMNAAKDLPKPRQGPLPPPRAKATLKKSLSTPLEDSTYDSPTNKSKTINNQANQSADYDSLFSSTAGKSNNDDVSNDSQYSHLNQLPVRRPALQPLPVNIANDDTYDTPQHKPQPSVRKPLSKPLRAAPLPPPARVEPKRPPRNTTLSSSAGSGDSVIMQLKKRNVQVNRSFDEHTPGFEFYDTPVSVITPEGYNQVGDIIKGGHMQVEKDADGYVTVPDSEPVTEDGIYQVPK